MDLKEVKLIDIKEDHIYITYNNGSQVIYEMTEENLMQISNYFKEQYQEHEKNVEDIRLKNVGIHTLSIGILVGGTFLSYTVNEYLYFIISFGVSSTFELIRKLNMIFSVRHEYKLMNNIEEDQTEVHKLLLKIR